MKNTEAGNNGDHRHKTSSPSSSSPPRISEALIVGATAGGFVEAALYPIDTIKTRLQEARGGAAVVLTGLYSGVAGNLAGSIPASAIFFAAYEPSKHHLLKLLPEGFSALAHFTAGAIGGLASSLVRVPTEVVKQKMQTGQHTSAMDALRWTLRKEGWRGMYAGYGSFLLRDLPFDAIQFCIYEQVRLGFRMVAKRELNGGENAVVGAVSGVLTGVVTTPMDVVKTRLMVQGGVGKYKGVVDCVEKIVKEEGVCALLKGIGPRVVWIGVGGFIFFGVLEKTRKIIAERNVVGACGDG